MRRGSALTSASGSDPSGAAVGAFIDEMCGTFTALARAREVHVQFNGEVIPYLLMADVGRHLEGLHAAADIEGAPLSEEAVRLCAFLSGAHASGGEDVRPLVEAVFVQSLEAPSESYAGMRRLLSPELRSSIEASWPGVDFG